MSRLRRGGFVAAAVIVFTMLFGPSEALADEPKERDVWYIFVAGGQPYGHFHVTVGRQRDGTFRYEVDSRLLMDFLGEKQEITEKAAYVVNADYSPVSLVSESTSHSGSARLRGRVDGEQFFLGYERAGLRRTASIDLSERPIFHVCLPDWLADQPEDVTKATRRVLNDSSLCLEDAVAVRVRGGNSIAWSVDCGVELGQQGQIRFDADGIPREADYRVPPFHYRRGTAEEAGKVTHRKLDRRELLMFPVEQSIGSAERLTSLTARLLWKDVPFERFELEDERQKVVSRSEKDGRYEAVLHIRQAAPTATDAAGDVGFPVESPEFKPWLAETRFIKPSDPDIVRQAREWIGDEKTALGAVRALSAGVSGHMQGGTMIVETLSGPEVLKSKQGKCSEYATLFASLARSAGIPTRIVLGMRLISGCWVGHMWNEAYVGRWVTVDSTVDEVGGSPALLKLVHSDSVFGTTPIRFGLVDSLEVTVEAFEAPAPTVAGDCRTGIEGNVYTNTEYSCRLTAPDANWTLKDVTSKRTIMGFKPPPIIRFEVPERDDVLIHLVLINVPPMITPKILLEARAKKFKSSYKGYEVLKHGDHPMHAGLASRILVFRREDAKKEGQIMKTTEVVWRSGDACFLLNLIADQKSHDEHEAKFFTLLGSFEALPKMAEETPLPNDAKRTSKGGPGS